MHGAFLWRVSLPLLGRFLQEERFILREKRPLCASGRPPLSKTNSETGNGRAVYPPMYTLRYTLRYTQGSTGSYLRGTGRHIPGCSREAIPPWVYHPGMYTLYTTLGIPLWVYLPTRNNHF